MPTLGTIEGYILKVRTKFEVNQLNRSRDFMSTFEYNFRQPQLSKCMLYLRYINRLFRPRKVCLPRLGRQL